MTTSKTSQTTSRTPLTVKIDRGIHQTGELLSLIALVIVAFIVLICLIVGVSRL